MLVFKMAKYKVIARDAYNYRNSVEIVDVDVWEYGEQYCLWIDRNKPNKLHKSKIKYYPSGTPYFVAEGSKQNLNHFIRTDSMWGR